MPTKPWWTSRTIIIGIVAAVVGAAATIANLVTGQEVLGLETQTTIIAVIAGAVMWGLRIITKKPVV